MFFIFSVWLIVYRAESSLYYCSDTAVVIWVAAKIGVCWFYPRMFLLLIPGAVYAAMSWNSATFEIIRNLEEITGKTE